MARPGAVAGLAPVSTYVRVRVGGERYALAVEEVREIAELGEVTAVPAAGPHVAGVRQLHGELLPVIRLERLLGAPEGEPRRIVVVQKPGRAAGLAVDAAEDIGELPGAWEHGGPLTAGTVLHEGTIVGVIDVPALLDAVAVSVG
jgi:purine-binding chemotaxis protein CheW